MKLQFDKMTQFIRYFLVEGAMLIAEREGYKNITKVWPDMFPELNNKDKSKKPKKWDIEVTINGKEVPMDIFFDLLEKSFDENIRVKAQDLIQTRFSKMYDLIDEVETSVKETFEREFPEYERDEDGYYNLKGGI